ncbi:MAG: DUF6607 family protein [Owenweeksia sp.]|nr:DUF6607 family protein [Owenweeksia sp.]
MKKLLFTCALFVSITGLTAQNIEEEKGYIKEMCGCFEVRFRYAETFSEAKNYEFHDRYSARGLEWIFVDEESPEELILQHYLIAHDTMVIKHWRQDWLYENRNLLTYQKNMEWDKKQLTLEEAKGTWTQKVYQVDDSPRYEGSATWVNVRW